MRTLIVILSLSILVGCSSNSQPDADTLLNARIERIENGLQPNLQIQGENIPRFNIEERLVELGIPGASIAVINNGKLEWAKGYGMADIAENRPVKSETMFMVGSVTKPVAAIRAHQLAEEGRLDLDANVNDYLKSWKLPDNEFTINEKVTTRRILNHTAGLTAWGFPGYDKGDTIPTVVEVLDGLGNTDPVRVYKEPGESWMYSGGGYTIMQLLITEMENKSFPDIMQESILDPLGMTSSTFENPLPEAYHSISATGYRANGDEVEGKWPIYTELAAAGLWTTPSQLSLFAKEIQEIYQSKKDGLLKSETVEEMLIAGMNDHGLGFVVNEHTFGHNGANEGFKADMVMWKKYPIAVVVAVNSDNGSIMREIMLSIAEEYKLPGIEPTMRIVSPKTVEERARFVGTYVFPEQGEAIVSIKDNGLEITGEFAIEPIILLPENDSTYFNRATGTYYTFVSEKGAVTGLQFWRFTGEKTE